MTLPQDKTRCPGKWEPNEQTYLHEECRDCMRYIHRNDGTNRLWNQAPNFSGGCQFKIEERK